MVDTEEKEVTQNVHIENIINNGPLGGLILSDIVATYKIRDWIGKKTDFDLQNYGKIGDFLGRDNWGVH